MKRKKYIEEQIIQVLKEGKACKMVQSFAARPEDLYRRRTTHRDSEMVGFHRTMPTNGFWLGDFLHHLPPDNSRFFADRYSLVFEPVITQHQAAQSRMSLRQSYCFLYWRKSIRHR
jgi:hypothetical protein